MHSTATPTETALSDSMRSAMSDLESLNYENVDIKVFDTFEGIYGGFDVYKRDGHVCFKHQNGGGLIAVTARVAPSVYVAESAAVLGRAWVRDDVRVEDNAVIDGDAQVTGSARLRHDSRVGDQAVLEGKVLMLRNASVGGSAHLRGTIRLDYFAHVGEGSRLFGNMHLE